MIPPPIPDLLDFNADLDDEESMVVATARRFVNDDVMPFIAQRWRDGDGLHDLYPKLGTLGFLGASLTGFDCAAMQPRAYGLLMKELERGDSCLRSIVGVQSNLVMYPLLAFGSPEQQAAHLPALRDGRQIGCFALSEPDAGSDPASMKTVATKRGSGFVIRGVKRWITNGTIADIGIVWARIGPSSRDIRAFLVDMHDPRIGKASVGDKQSFRASDTAELTFDDVEVSADAMLPRALGLKAALDVLNQARFGITWGVLGAAEYCLSVAISYAKDRAVFGKSLASYQLTQKKIVDAGTELFKAELLARDLAAKKQRNAIRPEHVSLAKFNNVKMALETARVAREILGGNGIMDDYGIMRHLCNLETVFTYEGTHDVHLLVVGQALTGENAFRG